MYRIVHLCVSVHVCMCECACMSTCASVGMYVSVGILGLFKINCKLQTNHAKINTKTSLLFFLVILGGGVE